MNGSNMMIGSTDDVFQTTARQHRYMVTVLHGDMVCSMVVCRCWLDDVVWGSRSECVLMCFDCILIVNIDYVDYVDY